ncbi:MAG: TonB-dependent siderophore receptor [Comamonadaceae bacterium]|nr:TonB-dependent siderophore receptor [Comamonadaceae bacterium]
MRPAPLALALAIVFAASPGYAQGSAAGTPMQISISAQPLAQALNDWARQTRIQLVVQQEAVAGKSAPAVSGQLNPRQALEQLLAGSGLLGRFEGNLVTVERRPDPSSSQNSLPVVTVTAQAEPGEATEHTGSYAASRVSLGKGQSIREIPQSITVVTRQRIEDQGLASVGDVMQQTTGVTVVSDGDGGVASKLYARGFEISSMQVDGAAVDAYSWQYFNPNLAMYDSVQIVRGADGLFSGNGEPGGSINLVRKRPLPQSQVLTTASVGSWNQYRTELDATGPLTQDGRVRGRAVLAHEGRKFHYDQASARKTLLYGILEADVTTTTKLAIGASYEQTGDSPWKYGLPRAASGADLGLSRSTSFMANWSEYNQTNRELFAQLEQQLAGNWLLKAQATHIKLHADDLNGSGFGAVDPATGNGPEILTYEKDHGSTKKSIDINVGGSFAMLGRQHDLLVGADWQAISNLHDSYTLRFDTPLPRPNVFNGFDPGSVPYPASRWKAYSYPSMDSTQKGLYGRLKLSLSDRLTAIVGGRYASYESDSPVIGYNQAGQVTTNRRTAYKESGIFTPYGGLVYDINDQWTTYASVAEIHKSQANNLQGPPPGTPLAPIKGRNYEIGIKGSFNGGRLTTALAIYHIDRNGQAVRDPSYPSTGVGDLGLNCCWIDQGRTTSKGLDAEVSGELTRDWRLFAGYTYNNNRNKATSTAYHSVTPKHLLRVWSTYRLPGTLSAWTLGGGVNVQSKHFVRGTANSYNPSSGKFDGSSVPYNFTQGGYAVWNASVQYRFHRNWTAVLNLNNLFDRVYYKAVGSSSSGNWYGEPRNVMLTLRGTF